jgi:arylsulfatase A-like enzyme
VHDISAGRAEAPEGTAAAFADLYDGEIAWNDHHFGRLIDRLRALDLYDPTLIVLLSDHGEEFFEHGGWEHGKTLYGEQLRIPLVVKLPRGEGAGRRIGSPADQVDVLPTILDYLGIEPPSPLDGRSLLPVVRDPAASADRATVPSFAYLRLEEKHVRSVVARGWKLIVDDSPHLRGEARELYRLADEPGERRNLYRAGPLERGFLEQTLNAFERDLRQGSRRFEAAAAEIDHELRRRLEALGYVQ